MSLELITALRSNYTYTYEAGGRLFRWNSEQIKQDCHAGLFGQPEEFSLDGFTIQADAYASGRMSLKRVRAIMRDKHRLNDPVILLDFNPLLGTDPPLHRLLVDGNHRMEARVKLKKKTFMAWVVPDNKEHLYRIFDHEMLTQWSRD